MGGRATLPPTARQINATAVPAYNGLRRVPKTSLSGKKFSGAASRCLGNYGSGTNNYCYRHMKTRLNRMASVLAITCASLLVCAQAGAQNPPVSRPIVGSIDFGGTAAFNTQS